MSILELPNNDLSSETHVRDLLPAKQVRPPKPERSSNKGERAARDLSGPVVQISDRSVQEIDHLIEGLRVVREKVSNDGSHLQREIDNFEAFNESVIQLTKIVSEGVAQVNRRPA
jgi:hypothetical protein